MYTLVLTTHGKISGLYLPLEQPDRRPQDIRRELAGVLADHLARQLEAGGVTEEEVQKDFDAFRRRRR